MDKKRAIAVRAKIKSETVRPRLSVFRSNKFIYASLIDVATGKTVGGVSGKKPEEVGQKIAELGVKLGLKEVVFDRGRYRYHGQVKILAEAARKGGLTF